MIIGVLLPLPFDEAFDYKCQEDVALGSIVKVSFGRDEHIGVVWQCGKTSKLDDEKIKPIKEVLDFPPFSKEMIEFIKFVAKYNKARLGLVLKMAISSKQAFLDNRDEVLYKLSGKTLSEAKLKNSDARWRVMDLLSTFAYSKADIQKGVGVGASVVNQLITAGVLEAFSQRKELVVAKVEPDFAKVDLTDEQECAASNLVEKLSSGFSVTLLDGVTGSGKTEVYFEAAAEAIRMGKQVLILVPEISLTTQWLHRFEKRFGIKPACWHSSLSNKERAENWRAIVENKAKVVVGARSALFLPYADLGLLVIDESHDSSFKQEDLVNYHCRDMAVVKAKVEGFPLVLSTATPDLETLINVESGKYDCVVLTKRYAKAKLPTIKVVDLKKDKPIKGEWGVSWLSSALVAALKENLEKKEQSMLFLNRRGYAPLLICRDCGYRLQCPHCTAWLAEHRHGSKLICHHCGYTINKPNRCPDCQSENGLTSCGPGVERVAEEVAKRFPDARVAVLSSDITSSLSEVSSVFDKMEKKELDIIIGTQILAKGHHFPELTLVGIVDADIGLMGSDLRASERTFQLLSQVSGRAGRAAKEGEVYIQTLYPDNPVLLSIIGNNRQAFVDLEKRARKALKMPPYGKLAAIIVSSESQSAAEKIAISLGQVAPNNAYITTLGPAPAPMAVLRNKFRYRLLLKTDKSIKIQTVVDEWLKKVVIPSKVRVEVDIDPYSFM